MPYKVIPRYGIGAIVCVTPIPGELFRWDFFEMYYGKFDQARPMKHEFCRDFVGTNAGVWWWRPL